MSRPLFSVGTARGGTNLLTKMLSVHAQVSMAADPYLPLFRSLRNGILRQARDPAIRAAVPPESILDDYYFSRKKWKALEQVQEATLQVPFQEQERPALLSALAARARLSSSHVVPHLDRLRGSSYEDLFRSALQILEMADSAPCKAWVGFNENWAVEFLPALARAFPEAKFLILLRDPRGPIASALKEPDPKKVPQVISFARHWRKAVALMAAYRQQPLFAQRLMVLTYEEMALDPERCAQQLCRYLDVAYDSTMLDTRRWRSADGTAWKGNSHQGASSAGIYTSSIRAWEKSMPSEWVELVEFICVSEMRFLDYEPVRFSLERDLSPAALSAAERDMRECLGWRSDSGELEQEMGCELFRQSLLRCEGEAVHPEWIRTSFLNEAAWEVLKSERREVSPCNGLS